MAENEKKVPETAEVADKETKAVKKDAKIKKEKKSPRFIAWLRTTKAEMKKIVKERLKLERFELPVEEAKEKYMAALEGLLEAKHEKIKVLS